MKRCYLVAVAGIFVLSTVAPVAAADLNRMGTGLEIGFAPNRSVAVEYDHLFMGSKGVTFPPSAITVGRSDNIREDVDMGTMRANYHF
jgi:hypothetical protein